MITILPQPVKFTAQEIFDTINIPFIFWSNTMCKCSGKIKPDMSKIGRVLAELKFG